MFTRVTTAFRALISKPTLSNKTPKPSKIEECTMSFWGLKISFKNPGWKTILIIILFLFTVLLIATPLRQYVTTLYKK